VSQPPDHEQPPRQRVVLDASILLGDQRRYFLAAVDLGYYVGFWSSWIVSEVSRKRTEWIAERAMRQGVDQAELRQRFDDSRNRVNVLIDDFSHVLRSVDYAAASAADLSWLADRDDWPVMQTALAAEADVLITNNSRDFPLGERRNGILILGSNAFLVELYARFPEAEVAVREYLREAR